MSTDTKYHARRHATRMQDPEYRQEYERARAAIDQVDLVMRRLNELREEEHLTKAQLARLVGKHPAALRRLFAGDANPEFRTLVSLASAMGAEFRLVRKPRRRGRQRIIRSRKSADVA